MRASAFDGLRRLCFDQDITALLWPREFSMKRLRAALLSLCLVAGPAAADVWDYGPGECNQLWFMRNLIMDRAGYCFGSTLGQALYDNSDCRGKQVTLTAAQQRQVAKIQKLERQIGCKVNTGRRQLDAPLMPLLRRLRDMPLPDNGASACTWAGPPLSLRDGYSPGARAIGQVDAGDRIEFGWIGEGSWNVFTISKGGYGGPIMLGWLDTGRVNFEGSCTNWAG